MSALAQAAAATGDVDRARRLLSEGEDLARALANSPWFRSIPDRQLESMSALARAAAATGDVDRARRLLCEAEELPGAVFKLHRKVRAMSALAETAARPATWTGPGGCSARPRSGPAPSPTRTGRRRR